MSALVLLAALAVGDPDLPRLLADDPRPEIREDVLPSWGLEPQAAKGKAPLNWYVGGRLGVASSFDSDDAAFDIGAVARLTLLPWLSLEGSIDIQTEQVYEHSDIHVFLLPIQFTALFYPPIDWPVKPYGLAGIGLYYEDIHFSGLLGYKSDKTALEPGFHFGFGADFELNPQLTFNADFRFAFINHPGGLQGNDLDYLQFTVGVLVKLTP